MPHKHGTILCSAITIIILLAAHIASAELPDGYIAKDLEPLGGELLIPKSWHFSGGMTNTGFLYTASKELRVDGSYDTGFRIQGIMKIRELYRISPLDAVIQNVEAKKKEAVEIIQDHSEPQEGLFEKRCLETIEKIPSSGGTVSYHVVSSFYWSDKMDIMVVLTFGAPVSEWGEEVKVYNVIKNFTLFDKAKYELNLKSSQN